MSRLAIALGFFLSGTAWAMAQDRFEEIRFHRVHLRNGNVIDGRLLQKSDRVVILRLLSGDISIRVDQIDHVEFIKMRSLIEAPPRVEVREQRSPQPGTTAPAPEVAARVVQRVEQILDEMRRAKDQDRFKIAQSFLDLGPEGARALTARLGAVGPDLWEAVVNILFQMNERSAIHELRSLLKHDTPEIRSKAVQLIARIGEPEFAEDVRPLLKDSNDQVRCSVLDLLRDLGGSSDIAGIADFCSSPWAPVRQKAIAAAVNLATKFDRKETLSLELLGTLDRVKTPIKVDLLQTLGKLECREIAHDLVRFLREESAEVRQAAVTALAEMGARDRGEDIVHQMSREEHPGTRMSFAVAAQRLQLRAAVPALIEWLETTNSDVRGTAIAALRSITSQDYGGDRARWAAWWEQNKK